MTTKICIFTGSRADYSLLKYLGMEIQKEKLFNLVILASGSHQSEKLGNTIGEVRIDNISEIVEIDIEIDKKEEYEMAELTGIAINKYNKVLKRMKPDFLIVLGDRYEALAVTITAHFNRIKIIHLHGGETTEGALDDKTRNAITQLSDIHFTSTINHSHRVSEMVKKTTHIEVVGPMCIDNIKNMETISNKQFELEAGYTFKKKNILMTYHPVTKEDDNGLYGLTELLRAIGKETFSKFNFLITGPNADNGGSKFLKLIREFSKKRNNMYYVNSLGGRLYMNALLKFDLVIGNSSSGLIEAPIMKIPVINIGNRQKEGGTRESCKCRIW